jgi:hypothetical protein
MPRACPIDLIDGTRLIKGSRQHSWESLLSRTGCGGELSKEYVSHCECHLWRSDRQAYFLRAFVHLKGQEAATRLLLPHHSPYPLDSLGNEPEAQHQIVAFAAPEGIAYQCSNPGETILSHLA